MVDIFSKAKDIPLLSTGLKYFISSTVKTSTLANSTEVKKALKQSCRLAVDTLGILDRATAS
jgi:hypothetical protein